MSTSHNSRHAAFLLRLLIDGGSPLEGAVHMDWDTFIRVGQRNVVLVRAAHRLRRLGIALPRHVAAAVAAEQHRVDATLEVARKISDACAQRGIAFLFPKVLQHYPDMGPDLDLLLLTRSSEVDQAVLAGLPASTTSRDLGSRIAGRTAYLVDGCSTPLDISHGRLGVVGEHTSYPTQLVANARPVVVKGTEFLAPSRNDHLVLQAMQRVYGRRVLRLSDFVYTIPAVRAGGIDWEYVLRTTEQSGVLHGLRCYLSYVDQIHRSLFDAPLLDPAQARRLALGGWGMVAVQRGNGGGVGFPSLRVNSRLYLAAFGSHLRAGQWRHAGRVCLAPAIAAAATARRLVRRHVEPSVSTARAPDQ